MLYHLQCTGLPPDTNADDIEAEKHGSFPRPLAQNTHSPCSIPAVSMAKGT